MQIKPDLCADSGCSLAKAGSGFTQLEVGRNYDRVRLLLCGEASGEAESRESLPFRPYAQSGSLLSDALRDCRIDRSEIAITNIVRCRPPKDYLEGAPYAANAISHCITNYLIEVIHELKPACILALGGTAYRALTVAPKGRYGTLDYMAGYMVRGAGAAEGVPVIGTHHPAYLRRGKPHLYPILTRSLRRAFALGQGLLVRGRDYGVEPGDCGLRYITEPSIDEAWEWAYAIDLDLPIAWDCETPKSVREDEEDRTSFADRDIKLVQFTQRRGEGIALPYRDEFIEVIKYILGRPNDKLTHNGWTFDDEVAEANGIKVAGLRIDCMVAYGAFWSDLPKNLQAAAQMAGFPFLWKHLGETDLAFYGCADVDATLAEYHYIRALLEREGLWESFIRYFAEVWPILADMARRGIPIDDGRRLELKELIERESVKIDAEIRALVPAEVLETKQKRGYKNPPILKCEMEGCGYEGRGDHPCSGGDMDGNLLPVRSYAHLAAAAGLVLREVEVGEGEKCRCGAARKRKGVKNVEDSESTTKTSITSGLFLDASSVMEADGCPVCRGTGLIPVGTVEMRWAALAEFNPNSWQQVIRFMKHMRHPVPKHQKRTTMDGEAADTTEMKELERLAQRTRHPIYPLLIQRRMLTKVEGTYVEGWKPSADSCVHTTYTFQTATWQTSSRNPNVQNGLKHGKTAFQKDLAAGFASMQRAFPGRILINFDFRSFHALTTAHDFNIPDYARLARIDIHSFVTGYFLKTPDRERWWGLADADMAARFKELKKDEGFKFVRDFKAKRAILGIQFGMGYRKLYQLNRDDFADEREARSIWEMVYHLFPMLRKAQDGVRQRAAEDKRLVSKFGAIRHFFDVVRWSRKDQKWIPGDQAEEAVAFLPASHAFGHVRDFLLRIRSKGWDERYGLCNSIHDSFLFHCRRELAEEATEAIKREMERPSTILIYPEMAPGGFWCGAEVSMGESLAECK